MLKDLWACKKVLAITWVFFFALALAGETPYTVFQLFLFSGLFTLVLISIVILLIRHNIKNILRIFL